MNARALAIALAAAAALSGCQANNVSLEMTNICDFPESCTWSETCELQMLLKPEIDPSLTDELLLAVQFRNQVLNNEETTAGRLNGKDAHVTHYDITYSGTSISIPAGSIDVNYVVPAEGTAVLLVWAVVPGSGADLALSSITPGGGSIPVTAHVVVSGEYMDGGNFKTGEFDIAFTSCNGAGCQPWTTCTGCPFNYGQTAACPAT
jgi:hypothetical protein